MVKLPLLLVTLLLLRTRPTPLSLFLLLPESPFLLCSEVKLLDILMVDTLSAANPTCWIARDAALLFIPPVLLRDGTMPRVFNFRACELPPNMVCRCGAFDIPRFGDLVTPTPSSLQYQSTLSLKK